MNAPAASPMPKDAIVPTESFLASANARSMALDGAPERPKCNPRDNGRSQPTVPRQDDAPRVRPCHTVVLRGQIRWRQGGASRD